MQTSGGVIKTSRGEKQAGGGGIKTSGGGIQTSGGVIKTSRGGIQAGGGRIKGGGEEQRGYLAVLKACRGDKAISSDVEAVH